MAKKYQRQRNQAIVMAIVIVACIALDGFVWRRIFVSFFRGMAPSQNVAHDYFLDVGQGSSELILFPDGTKILIDAGLTDAVVGDLESVLPQGDDYIDLAVISDPEPDAWSGYNFLLDHYRVGAFAYDGRDSDPPDPAWGELLETLKEKGIPLVTLARGDEINFGKDDGELDVLSPNPAFVQSADVADASLVLLMKTSAFSTILMPEAGANVEGWLLDQHDGIHADVLSIGDQISASPSRDKFLRTANPAALIVAPVPKTNRAQSVSSISIPAHFTSAIPNALILSTTQNGTIEIYSEDGKLKIIKEK